MKSHNLIVISAALGFLCFQESRAQICVELNISRYHLIQGETFHVLMGVSGVPKNSEIVISTAGGIYTSTDNGEILEHEDTGITTNISGSSGYLSISDRSIGVHKHTLKVKVMQQNKVADSREMEVVFRVSPIVLSLHFSDANVCYARFDNPFTVAVAGIPPEELFISCTDGMIKKMGNNYSLFTKKDSGEIRINVAVKTGDGAILSCGSFRIKVKRLIPSIGLNYDKVSARFSRRISTELPIATMAVKPQVVSWQLSIISENKVLSYSGTGDTLTDNAMESMNQLKAGDKIILENVIVRMPAETHKLHWMGIRE